MYLEAKKLQIIEEVLKIESDTVLLEIEKMLSKTVRLKTANKASAHDFVGLISEKDILLMDAAIEDGCEQINPDDWQ